MKILLFHIALALMAAAPVAGDVLVRGPLHVQYHPGDEALAERSADVIEEALNEFGPRLALGDEPIYLVITNSLGEFLVHAKRFSQVSVSGIARSRDGLIVVKAPYLNPVRGDYHGTLRHELVHVLLYRNTDTGRLPRWLNEGLAMSLANEYRWASSFTVSKMFLYNRIIPYRNLDFAFLAPGNEMEFNDAYAQALSMTRYLRERLGEEAFWEVVLGCKAMVFPDALREYGGISVLDMWNGYQRSLWLVALVSTLASGSFFAPAAVLVVVAFFRKRHSNKHILRRWEREEAEASPEELFSWDAIVEDPEAWKQGQ